MVIMENARKRKKRANCINDQRGFTLVELLIGIVILSLVVVAIGSFMVVGSRSYAAANTEIILQQEAQLAMNQISDVIIDTTRSVNYAGYAAGDGTPVLAEKDADFTFTPEDKTLTLFNGVDTVDEDGNVVTVNGSGNQKNYQFYYNKEEETLYYSEIDVTDTSFPADEASGQVVLAEYVTDFSVDLTQVVEKRVVQISMSFESNNKTYTTSNNITIRNKVGVNDVDLEKLDKRKTLSVTPKEPSVILEPGETYHFSTPKVSGSNVLDKSVTWDFTTDTSHHSGTVFTDATNGTIQISTSETETSFKVLITTNAVDSEGNHATAEVIVYVKRAKEVSIRKSADDNASNGANEVSAGKGFTLSAEALGNKLGVSCSGCGNENIAKDKYVVANEYPTYGWTILQGGEIVTMNSSDNKTAKFTVSSTAKKGDIIEIRATSLLSLNKGYTLDSGSGAVSGTIILTVAEGADTPIHIDFDGGDLEYGVGSYLLNMVGIDSDDPAFLIVVRVKKSPDAPVSDDMVMVYASEGTNARLSPDTWLLNMNQEYFISVQVIDILSDTKLYKDGNSTNNNGNNKTEEYNKLRATLSAYSGNQTTGTTAYQELKSYVDSTFWPEYTSNLDSSGSYNGKMYTKYSNLLPGKVRRPQIGVKSYLDNYANHFDGVDVKTMYAVQKNEISVPVPFGEITSTWGSAVFQNYAYYNVYKGASKDSSKWEKLYWLPENNSWGANLGDWNNYKNNISNYQGTGRIYDTFKFSESNLANYTNAVIKASLNTSYDNKKRAVGTYHYVPAFAYVNKPLNLYLKISDNYEKYDGIQWCYDYKSAVNFTLKQGGNLTLWANTNDSFKHGEIFFPEPSDTMQFKVMGESFTYSDSYLLDGKGELHDVTLMALCEYNNAAGRYELKLYYDATDITGRKQKCYAGTFWYSERDEKWEQLAIGTYDEQLQNGNMTIVGREGNLTLWAYTNAGFQHGEIYFPEPSNPVQFGQIPMGSSFTYVDSYLLANGNLYDVTLEALCKWNGTENRYELELYYYAKDALGARQKCSAGTFWCSANGNKWEQLEKGTYDQQLNNGNTTITTKGNVVNPQITIYGETKTGIAYIPLPSDSDFRTSWGLMLGQQGEQIKDGWYTIKFQAAGNTYTQEIGYRRMICTYDKNTDTYTLEFFNSKEEWWPEHIITYDLACKFKCKGTDSTWTQIIN